MAVIRSHDALFRFVFGEPEQMGELLRGSLSAPVAAAIDWATLRLLGGAFVDEALSERHADLLFEAQLGGQPLLLYVLVEHKSEQDPFTALQLLRYVVRVWDRWRATNPEGRTLPPVLPLVVHHGDRAWTSPRTVTALVDFSGVPEDVATFLRGLQPQLAFVLDDVAAGTEGEIDARRLPPIVDLCLRFLQVLRHLPTEQMEATIVRWGSLLRTVLDHPRGRVVTDALFCWFLSRDPDAESILRKAMKRIDDMKTRDTMKSSLDQLLDRGHLRGQRELLHRQLLQRFGVVPADVVDRLAAGSVSDFEAWSVRVLTARTCADVFDDS